jgi:hypothetical protein
MGNNRTGKYLKYDIGKIILVMIGIPLTQQNYKMNKAKSGITIEY